MSLRQKIEETATEFLDQVAQPMAERVRSEADDWFERVSGTAQDLGSRVSAQLADVPSAAMARFDVVPAKAARRRTFFGILAGLTAGAALAYFFNRSEGADRRARLKARIGLGSPETAAAATNGHLPK